LSDQCVLPYEDMFHFTLKFYALLNLYLWS